MSDMEWQSFFWWFTAFSTSVLVTIHAFRFFTAIFARLVQMVWAIRLCRATVFDANLGTWDLCEHGRLIADVRFLRLRPDVEVWCRENLRHGYGVAPSFTAPEWSMGPSRRIWFRDANEAFMFKIKWL